MPYNPFGEAGASPRVQNPPDAATPDPLTPPEGFPSWAAWRAFRSALVRAVGRAPCAGLPGCGYRVWGLAYGGDLPATASGWDAVAAGVRAAGFVAVPLRGIVFLRSWEEGADAWALLARDMGDLRPPSGAPEAR